MITKNDEDVVARTIFGEARGEYRSVHGGLASLIAIANVIFNRYKKSTNCSVSDICQKPFQFSCWNESDKNHELVVNVDESDDLYLICKAVARNVLSENWPDITKNSTNYYSCSIPPPAWSLGKTPSFQIGKHMFFSSVQ
jgi:spore germination cell wall hydrolase CwlJ-like protein